MKKLPPDNVTTLEQFDRTIKPHLHYIEAGASMAARHARALTQRPDFETLSEAELSRARDVLQAALSRVITAQALYRETPPEPTRAA